MRIRQLIISAFIATSLVGVAAIDHATAGLPGPTISINNATVVEGNSGEVTANFTVTLEPISVETVFVSVRTHSGSASIGTDFSDWLGNFNFFPGQTSKQFNVPVHGDLDIEGVETFTSDITFVDGATLTDDQGIGTIQTDDLCRGQQPTLWGDGIILGTNASEIIGGSNRDDIMKGGGGNDVVCGGPGDDLFSAEGAFDGNDVYDGGVGVDAVSYFVRGLPVDVSIDNVANDGTGAETDDVKTNVEQLYGGHGSDVLKGSSAANALFGEDGADRLTGQGGNDRLNGQVGADILNGGPGNDQASGGNGADTLKLADGVNGNDTGNGGPGVDTATADPGDTVINVP